jgi:hypothetical protein
MTSVAPPAANGTTMVTGRVGQVWAAAGAVAARKAAKNAAKNVSRNPGMRITRTVHAST